MISDRERELLSAAIDGSLDPRDQAEVERLLADSAAARAFKAELEDLEKLLKGIPELDPPASLHAEIMARAQPAAEFRNHNPLGWLRDLQLGAGLRYALAAATGALAAAVFLPGGGTPGTPDLDELVGTMAPGSQDTLDDFSATGPGFDGHLQLRRGDQGLLLDVLAEADDPIDITINLTGSELWPDAVAQFQGRADSIGISGQAISVRVSGRQQVTILLRRDDAAVARQATIALEFTSNGSVLQRGTLTAGFEGGRQ
ncbi:MAG: hypothetical protein R3315_03330 [Woeseiaceae bacterium]|nr:hypothetical protein [Woeseiaceae bacterium]